MIVILRTELYFTLVWGIVGAHVMAIERVQRWIYEAEIATDCLYLLQNDM